MVMEEQQLDMELASERVPVPQVQKSTEKCHVEPNNKVTSSSRGKPRLRKKALHAAILKQMEFYFSDANLAKDRFLQGLIEENPYVDLNIFIRFNKIRELTTDTNRIAKALQSSTVLELSHDGTKVQRITPINQKENIDDCTVYVQNLPADTDHEKLSTIFSQYGHVVYVSVPKYKSNKKIKGFAFVEFETPEQAEKCLKAFQKKGCVLPSNTSPNDLLSITTFDNADKDVTQYGRTVGYNEDNACVESTNDLEKNTDESTNKIEENPNKEVDTGEEQKDSKKAKKRKHSQSLADNASDLQCSEASEEKNEDVSHKKPKSQSKDNTESCENESVNNKTKSEDSEDSSEKVKAKKVKIDSNETENKEIEVPCKKSKESIETEDAIMTDGDNEQKSKTSDKKKKRKRRRSHRMEDANHTVGLQIMAKRDWKVLRNKYLDLQRSKMKQLKQHLRKTRWNQWSNYEKNKVEKEEHDEKDKTVKQDVSSSRYTFTPGVIVKIEMDKPCTDPKNFKMELRGNSAVKYIDVEEGSFHAYVRCETADAAQSFAQKSTEERQMSILQDEEEKMYWDKIAQDREEKLGKKIRVKQRGRNKLLKKAEKALGKHIKFDDEV